MKKVNSFQVSGFKSIKNQKSKIKKFELWLKK